MLVLCTKLIKNYNRKLETKAAKETYLNVVSYIQILHFSILHKDDFFFFLFSPPNDFSSLCPYFTRTERKKHYLRIIE